MAVLRQNPYGQPACQRFRADLLARERRTRGPQRLRCPARLTETAVPVLANSHHVATIIGYRVSNSPPSATDINCFAKAISFELRGLQARRLREAYRRMAMLPAAIQRSHLLLLQMLAEQLGEMIRRVLAANYTMDPVASVAPRNYFSIPTVNCPLLPSMLGSGRCRRSIVSFGRVPVNPPRSTGRASCRYLPPRCRAAAPAAFELVSSLVKRRSAAAEVSNQ